jgi:hypothetical protein
MDTGFQTVFDLQQTGYRDSLWFFVGFLLFIIAAVLIDRYARNDSSERTFRLVLWCVWSLILAGFLLLHALAYNEYAKLRKLLLDGDVLEVTGHIAYIGTRDNFDILGVDGHEFRLSGLRMPYRLGFQAEEFPLRPTFLVKVTTVEDVVVLLQIHKVHLH